MIRATRWSPIGRDCTPSRLVWSCLPSNQTKMLYWLVNIGPRERSYMKLTTKIRPFPGIMGWLETSKKEHSSNEAISNDVVAQAHLENYALKLFTYADQQDRAANFGKCVWAEENARKSNNYLLVLPLSRNVVKAFYTAGLIYDVLITFGELSDEAQKNGKYSKWKAAYIHNCLKNGETPVPGKRCGLFVV